MPRERKNKLHEFFREIFALLVFELVLGDHFGHLKLAHAKGLDLDGDRMWAICRENATGEKPFCVKEFVKQTLSDLQTEIGLKLKKCQLSIKKLD